MDQNMEEKINKAKTYQEKAILLVLAFDDDNDRRLKHIYEYMRLISKDKEGSHGNNNQGND